LETSTLSLDISAAQLSRGNLPGIPAATMQPAETNVITVVLENVAGAKGAYDTNLTVVLIFDSIKIRCFILQHWQKCLRVSTYYYASYFRQQEALWLTCVSYSGSLTNHIIIFEYLIF
jgi:hypothetical protein